MSTSVTCLCGDVALTVHLDSTNHGQLQLCHCYNCRAVTGLLCCSYYLMQHDHDPPVLDALREYRQSDHVRRLFCKTCGAHVLARLEPSGRYLVASGVLVGGHIPPVQSIQHWQANETRDGGLSKFLPGANATASRCILETLSGIHDERPQEPSPQLEYSKSNRDRVQDRVPAHCHCGGIQFYMTRPDASSSLASSPWPDVLLPYHSGSSDNPDDVKWWLRDGNTKYLAGTCACTSCRLGSGFPIQTWAFVPRANLFQVNGSPLSLDCKPMRRYNSSPGVYREFCGCCGATVFWHSSVRPELIDVSVGLLHGEGARAERWLEWASRVSFVEMAEQNQLVQQLQRGLIRNLE